MNQAWRAAVVLIVSATLVLAACSSSKKSTQSGGAFTQTRGNVFEANCGGGFPMPCEPDDGSGDELDQAYIDSFEEACAEVWSNTPDGHLYYGGEAFTEDDCTADEDPSNLEAVTYTSEASDQGTSDGYDAAFELSPTGVLCWGRDCWSRSDF